MKLIVQTSILKILADIYCECQYFYDNYYPNAFKKPFEEYMQDELKELEKIGITKETLENYYQGKMS